MTTIEPTFLKKYQHHLRVAGDAGHELHISPCDGEGVSFSIFGTFSSVEPTIALFSMPGLVFDIVSDDDIDPEFNSRCVEAVLSGNYEYSLEKRSVIDRIQRGGMYLRIGSKDSPLFAMRCVNQRAVKAMFLRGELKSAQYKLK